MKAFLLFICLSMVALAQQPEPTDSPNVKIWLFNNSKYHIESYTLKSDGKETAFRHLAPDHVSPMQQVNGFWKDQSYDLVISKKTWWGKRTAFHLTHIPKNKPSKEWVDEGKYLIEVSIRKKNGKFQVNMDYLEE